MHAMNIGQAATASGVSAKMIRHYEQVGLFPEPDRTDAGYRQYSENEVHTLRFIRQARDLGFSIQQIGELVGLWQNRRRPSRQVKALAEAHIRELEQKAQDLLAMKATLEHLVQLPRRRSAGLPYPGRAGDGEPGAVNVPEGQQRRGDRRIAFRKDAQRQTRLTRQPPGTVSAASHSAGTIANRIPLHFPVWRLAFVPQ